jgi:hypothetical protein
MGPHPVHVYLFIETLSARKIRRRPILAKCDALPKLVKNLRKSSKSPKKFKIARSTEDVYDTLWLFNSSPWYRWPIEIWFTYYKWVDLSMANC